MVYGLESAKEMTGPGGFPFCLGKVHENTPYILILKQFLTRFYG